MHTGQPGEGTGDLSGRGAPPGVVAAKWAALLTSLAPVVPLLGAPGFLLAATTFWSEGIHSGTGGLRSMMAMHVVMALGTFGFWALIAWCCVRINRKPLW